LGNKPNLTPMRKPVILIWMLFLIIPGFTQTYTVETVPNTKLVNNSYVSNPDNILSEEAVSRINTVLSELESKTTVQVAVVVLQSIGEEDHIDFSQRLFERWGIGRSGKDNGLLILMVMDQRTVRFHTGYGLEGVLPDITCKHIQMERMIPHFRDENYNAGMISGVEEVAFILNNPEFADEIRENAQKQANGWNDFFTFALWGGGILFLIWFLVMQFGRHFSDSKLKPKDKIPYPEMRMKRMEWLLYFGVVPFVVLLVINFMNLGLENHILVFLGLLYGYFIVTLLAKRIRMKKVVDQFVQKKDYYGATEFFQDYQGGWLFSAIVFPLPMLFLFFQYLARKKFYRNHPRDCKTCAKPLKKLDEKADDRYLKKSQLIEEQLASVDYDVWLCDGCQGTEILHYINRSSKYEPCPQCHARAYFKESDRTIVSATYDSSGTGEITRRCINCRHVNVSTYTIPQKTRSSDSSSSGGGSGGGGGSWGGGSSGGGGASSSW